MSDLGDFHRRAYLRDCIETGTPVPDLRADDLPLLQDLAAWYLDNPPAQAIKAQIALMEAAKANQLATSTEQRESPK